MSDTVTVLSCVVDTANDTLTTTFLIETVNAALLAVPDLWDGGAQFNPVGAYFTFFMTLSTGGAAIIAAFTLIPAESSTNFSVGGFATIVARQSFSAVNVPAGTFTTTEYIVTGFAVGDGDVDVSFDASAPFTPTLGSSSSPFTICFQKGTKILTPTGYHLVEQLKAGDALISAKDGSTRVPIKSMVQFIGKKEDGALYCLPKDTLGKNKPLNDLYMSGDHAFKAGPVWKHMKCAAGGAKETDADDIEYFHIILDDYFAHTIVAEGVEVESCFEDKGDGVLMSWACSEVSCTPLKCEFKPIKKASLNAGPIFKLLGNKKEEEKTIIIWAYNKELKRNMPLTCTEITLPK